MYINCFSSRLPQFIRAPPWDRARLRQAVGLIPWGREEDPGDGNRSRSSNCNVCKIFNWVCNRSCSVNIWSLRTLEHKNMKTWKHETEYETMKTWIRYWVSLMLDSWTSVCRSVTSEVPLRHIAILVAVLAYSLYSSDFLSSQQPNFVIVVVAY